MPNTLDRRIAARLTTALLVLAGASPGQGRAQAARQPVDTTSIVADSSDLLSVGRAAQAVFERRRTGYLPVTLSRGGGDCDERVGRFCTWYGEGEWYPVAERDEIVALRRELVAVLDSLQENLPGDGWLLGQRTWYRSEGGDWPAALRTARACGSVERWWCRALEGFALHGLGRYEEALAAFEEALSGMEPERADDWRFPRRPIDRDARGLVETWRQGLEPDSARAEVDRLWTLADPLFLVAGNDRLTAHYARWTVSTLRERARNPFRIRWGDDLETLTIRHGWEMGWERSPSRDWGSLDHVIGHKHPEGRDYMPSGTVLAQPGLAAAEELMAGTSRPRSLYAPDYAPVLLPMDGQLVLFPRGTETVVVATTFLPEDTTYHADHEHDVPWLDPGDQAGMPDRAGVFAWPVGGGRLRARTSEGSAEGVLMLTLPTGAYVVSAEAWSPERRRAGRLRVGAPERPAPEDIATLSDLLLTRPLRDEPTSLEEALPAALLRPEIRPGQSFAIAWEVAGLGFRPEELVFDVSVERSGVGVLRRIGQFLRLSEPPQPLVLSWREPGPDRPTHHFRYLDLDLPSLDEGEYEIRLVLRTADRSDAVSTARFAVRRPD